MAAGRRRGRGDRAARAGDGRADRQAGPARRCSRRSSCRSPRCSARMEARGVALDVAYLEEMGDERARPHGGRCRHEIYREAGEEFNLNSPPQLRVILYEKLGLSPGKKHAEGRSCPPTRACWRSSATHPDRRRAARLARAGQAELDLPRGAAAAGRSARRPDPHVVQPGGGGDRPARRRRTRTCRTSRSGRELGRQIRRAFIPGDAGQVLLVGGLLADRAARSSRTCRATKGCARRSRRATTSTPRRPRRCSDLPRTRSTRELRRRGEDGQLRARVRDERVGARVSASTSRPTRRRRSWTRTSRGSPDQRVPGRAGGPRDRRGLHRDAPRAPALHPGAPGGEPARPGPGAAPGAERADPGQRVATCSRSR